MMMRLKHINNLLFAATVLILLYIIVAPVLPALTFWVQSRTNRGAELAAQLTLPSGKVNAGSGDRIIVPSMLLNEPINEGADLRALNHGGTWRRPKTSTPSEGGNTVIVAHRYTYTNPRGTFYFLDKVKVGDQIGVFWHGKRYVYSVASVKTVGPNESSIEAPAKNAQLTLYTCTPLWLPKDRLVVTANLEKP